MGSPASATARVARLAWAARHAARLASAAAAREASFVAGLFDYDRPRRRRSSLLPARDPVPGVDVTAKDLESDEAVWALYENWCKAFNKQRSRDEMAHRFSVFKLCAEDVHELNQTFRDDPDEQMRLDKFCNGLDAQQIAQLKNDPRLHRAFYELMEDMRIDYPPNQSP